MSRRYDLIIFDWDGTLMDSVGRIVESWHRATVAMGLPQLACEQVRGIIGLSMDTAIKELNPAFHADDVQQFRAHYKNFYLADEVEPTPLFDGVEELLQQLSESGHQLAVATGKARLGLERAFAESGMKSFFADSRTACETASKPDPQMILELCEALGVAPNRTLMVGDARFDLEMGHRAGADVVGVSYGAAPVETLRQANPRTIIDTPMQLLDWI